MAERQRILVTGSSGFIGQKMLAALTGHEAVPYDYGKTFVHGPFDGIIHLAGTSRVAEGVKNPSLCLRNNLLLTADMLDMNPSWFIFASTTELPSASVYGLSKRMAEDYVKLMHPKYIIFRMANVYGPSMADDKFLPMLRRGEIKTIYPCTLPFEHIHVDTVVEMLRISVAKFDEPSFKPFTMKLATGVARTEEELRNVAASY